MQIEIITHEQIPFLYLGRLELYFETTIELRSIENQQSIKHKLF